MSPTQYRALERLLDAVDSTEAGGLILTLEGHDQPGRVHPRTAEALERRGLAEIIRGMAHDEPDLAIVTDAGAELLARNPEPQGADR